MFLNIGPGFGPASAGSKTSIHFILCSFVQFPSSYRHFVHIRPPKIKYYEFLREARYHIHLVESGRAFLFNQQNSRRNNSTSNQHTAHARRQVDAPPPRRRKQQVRHRTTPARSISLCNTYRCLTFHIFH